MGSVVGAPSRSTAHPSGIGFHAPRDLDLPVRRGRGRHVDDDRRLLEAGERDREWIRAEHPLRAPERRDGRGRVRHGPADQIALERLEHVVARDAVVIRVPDAHPAAADGEGFLHGDRVRLRADDESEAVAAVYGRRARRFAHDGDFRLGIDPLRPQHVEVGVKPRDAVRVDAAQIGCLEDGRGRSRVVLGDPEVAEDTDGELEELLRRKDLCVGHRG